MTLLRETSPRPIREATGQGRYRVRIIEGDRWGSTGFYPREVLERDGASAFPAGTQMYLDHPTMSDDLERPERSVRDLAGQLVTAPVYEGDGLYADMQVAAHWQPLIEGLRDMVGLSIRANGQLEEGEAQGRQGRIVTSLAESDGSHSVDFVTRAGAGGRIASLIESVRPQPLREVHGMTANDLQNALHDAVRRTWAADEDTYASVSDFDEDWVVFRVSSYGSDAETGLFRSAYSVSGNDIELSAERERVRQHTEFRPVSESTTARPTPEEEPMPEIDDLRESNRGLTEQVQTLTEARDTAVRERDEARTEQDRLRDALLERDARDHARAVLSEHDHDLRPRAQDRVVEAAVRDIPTTDDGLDRDALAERVRSLADEETAYIAEAAGRPVIRDAGGQPVEHTFREAKDYQSAGLSEGAAKVLATHR